MKTEEFIFSGNKAIVILPENPNGKYIWKTEFFYAFDGAERALSERGYTRVTYQISNRYGSDEAVRLMHAFQRFLTAKYGLSEKAILFGFSRGALYAFNYALFYPEYVDRIYLDAPVLNLRSWPPRGSAEFRGLLAEYRLTEDAFDAFGYSPIDRLREFSQNDIPLLIVAGDSDHTVPHGENCGILADYYRENGLPLEYILKKGCDHHPHSLEDVTPIIDFVEGRE